MWRPLLIAVLVLSLLLHGCAGRQHAAPSADDNPQELRQTIRKYSRSDD
jgi:hypothetical protein